MNNCLPMVTIAGMALMHFATGTAEAHHSFTAHYDSRETVEITGVVANYRLVSPHSSIAVDVTNENGSVEQWTVETNSANAARRRGWDENTFRPGDKITVTGYPHRRNRLQMHGTEFLTAHGMAPARQTAEELAAAYPPDPGERGLAGRWVPQRRGASGPPGSPLR